MPWAGWEPRLRQSQTMSRDGPLQGRRAIAVLLSRFPSLTETFILREITEMERQGQPVRLVPLLHDSPPVVHPEALPWIHRALYTPFLSAPIILANLRALLHRPGLYLGLLLHLVVASLRRPRFLVGTLGIFPKSVYLATRLADEGVRHLHAHFGSHPATAAFIISAFSGATFSVTLHAHDLFMPLYTPFLGPKLRAAAFVRVISEFNRRYLLRWFPGVAPEKVFVVHVGIPVGDYSPSGPPASPPGDGAGARVLSVAGLRPYKGLSVLVDACRILRDQGIDVQCTLVGEGPLRRALEQQIAGEGLEDRLHLAGAVTQGRVAELLRDRPIFALPSVVLRNGMMDGIPVALMEAMAAGVPVLASRISGIPELIEDGVGGILLEPGDSRALARSIRRLAEDPELSRSLGDAGARKVRAEFSLDRCTRQLLELVDRHNPPVEDPLPPSSAWRRHGPEACGPSGEGDRARCGIRILHDGPDSQVVEVLPPDPGGPRPLVVKVHKDRPGQSRPPADRARHEYEVMARLTSGWGNGGGESEPLLPAPVPRLLDLDADAGLLVMEASSGRRLDHLLRAARTGGRHARDEAGAAYGQAGQWLQRFQEMTASSVDPAAAVEAWRTEAMENLERAAHLLPHRTRSRVVEVLDSLEAAPPSAGMAASGHHGDLWPGNVLVGAHGVEVVDFEGYRPGIATEDPAHFLLQSEFFFDLPLLRRRFGPLRAAFLRGYGREDLPSLESYRKSRMSACLRLLAMAPGSPPPRKGFALRRRIRHLNAALDEALA
jgi:colanic acid/amylovoran biosynthesis glycosyltransferase